MSAFKYDQFRVSVNGKIQMELGWTYNGLGIAKPVPTQNRFYFIHLNSGSCVGIADCPSLEVAQDIGAEIADGGDMSFDGLGGYKNQYPELPFKVRAVMEKHLPNRQMKDLTGQMAPVQAKAIALLREQERLDALAKEPKPEADDVG